MITTDQVGFTSAKMEADNFATLYAKLYDTKRAFHVGMDEEAVRAHRCCYFDADACHEASAFFLKLADELDRREGA